MQYINKIELQGKVGSVRISHIGTQKTITFSLETASVGKTKAGDILETTWHNCCAWETTGIDPEIFNAQKGRWIHLEGRIRNSRYINSSGVESVFSEIIAHKIKVLEEGLPSVGDTIKIVRMDDRNGTDPQAATYNGKTGVITHIDGIGQLHGTWGGLAVLPDKDEFTVITE